MTLYVLNDIAYDAESTKNLKLLIIASSKSETMNNTSFASFDIKFTRLDFENAC